MNGLVDGIKSSGIVAFLTVLSGIVAIECLNSAFAIESLCAAILRGHSPAHTIDDERGILSRLHHDRCAFVVLW